LKTRIVVLGILSIAVAGLAQDDRRARIDVDSYVIDAQVNPETQTLTARATVRFVPDDQSNAVTFELNNALNISRIVDEKGQSLQSSRNQTDNTVRVVFPDGLRSHSVTTGVSPATKIHPSTASNSPPSSRITHSSSTPRAGFP